MDVQLCQMAGQMEIVYVLSILLVNSSTETLFFKSIDAFYSIKKMGN